jgi:Xaa-Pro aminopeptidase
MTTSEKIAALRKLMAARNVAALIVPSCDPHQSETVSPRWQARQWVSGFTGSAGSLVITAGQAMLWVDGRYFIQAEQELKGSGIRLLKSREPGIPTMNEWILSHLKKGQTVACDGALFSVETARDMKKAFSPKQLQLRMHEDLVGRIWKDRPGLPVGPALDYPLAYAGASRRDKLKAVRAHLAEKKTDYLLLASLDDIAWLFNIRGSDVANCPVVLAYALVGRKTACLFADKAKFSEPLKKGLATAGVRLYPYDAVAGHLKTLPSSKSLSYNPLRVSHWLADALPDSLKKLEETPDITTAMKAVKNPVEQGHFHKAALIDGLALVRFMAWLDRALKAGEPVTEYSAGEKMASLRGEAPECRGDSFPAICGYQANGAIVHYRADARHSSKLGRKGLLLVDSGGQYFGGTMDTTRTMALGPVPREACLNYTRVLKGFLALSRVHFPAGTTGTHLDTLARLPLWAAGLNYRHGSGHGVGSYLNVHEGPHGFSQAWNPCALKSGMVTTIEPGYYEPGKYGIRIENMVFVKPYKTTGSGQFLQFETLTLCPLDTAPIVMSRLTSEERDWLNRYHRRVWSVLSPRLDLTDRAWLKRKTAPI